ncbi:Glyoxylase, beta-lactamase superfamily II [Malonomonas rubra DSM 5091]|uniref:Glyoxylase, beta-lactamase superfamily II n=1 Tax=Malonomonas rubra DSM 5091 TaxID=1122189 RepID=A0A1M6DIY9_MALRU|nr:MBL fold metallo-hydrolase [Malonomonas rubra]SHI73226.1 Glyoxylase, beta-lactamase superfamily II [Malonomonas rubra DSM 5091]
MILDSLETGPLQVNCYIVGCEKTRKAVVIDPGGDADRILDRLQKHNLQLQMVINTHGHFDHVGGNKRLLEATGVELLLHEADKDLLGMAAQHAGIYGLPTELSPQPDKLLVDGDIVHVGELELKVLHTPGHTSGGICLLVDDQLIVGDTLFAGSIGRTDLPGGNHEQLIQSIRTKLLPLPDGTAVHPGHGPSTSIGREKVYNPFLS